MFTFGKLMKVIEHILKKKNPKDLMFSYEIVPPPRGRSISDIVEIVESLVPYRPAWIDVTSHSASAYYKEKADGTVERKIFKKRPGTIGICGVIQNRFKIDTVTHLLTQGFTKEETEDALIELNFLGIQNVLALRGDGLNYEKVISKNRSINPYASDLVLQIANINKGIYLEEISEARPYDFCIGVAGYPEKHFEAPNLKMDIKNLKTKVDNGANYIATQMFFDNKHYFNFVKMCRDEGITVPIVPGLKILSNPRQLSTIPSNFYINLPDELVESVNSDPKNIKSIGVEWALKQAEELLEFGVPTLHFYIMNDTSSVLQVVKKLSTK